MQRDNVADCVRATESQQASKYVAKCTHTSRLQGQTEPPLREREREVEDTFTFLRRRTPTTTDKHNQRSVAAPCQRPLLLPPSPTPAPHAAGSDPSRIPIGATRTKTKRQPPRPHPLGKNSRHCPRTTQKIPGKRHSLSLALPTRLSDTKNTNKRET